MINANEIANLMGVLKAFANERDIALLAIHHIRKIGDDDAFNTVSGSNGLMGYIDETMVLHRKTRGSNAATLNITGRDVKDQGFSVALSIAAGSSWRRWAMRSWRRGRFLTSST